MLHTVTFGSSGLHMVASGYLWLQWVKYGYSGLHMITVGYIWLHHVTYVVYVRCCNYA